MNKSFTPINSTLHAALLVLAHDEGVSTALDKTEAWREAVEDMLECTCSKTQLEALNLLHDDLRATLVELAKQSQSNDTVLGNMNNLARKANMEVFDDGEGGFTVKWYETEAECFSSEDANTMWAFIGGAVAYVENN